MNTYLPLTAGVSFITDTKPRESIRGDIIAFANQAFSGGEWKAATVLVSRRCGRSSLALGYHSREVRVRG
jgi:hypothetical protein